MKIILIDENNKVTGRYVSKSATANRLKHLGYSKNNINEVMNDIDRSSNTKYILEVQND